MTKTRPYKMLAKFYDQAFAVPRSWKEAAHKALLYPMLPRVKVACDLACGSGNTALELAQIGIRVFAVDLSPTMCAVTRRKAAATGFPIRVLRADMRGFRLPEPVDLVTCEFDAVNHVSRKADLARIARSVVAALRPGGTFLFDVNNQKGFESYWKGTVQVEKADFVLFMASGYDARHHRAWCDCDWFIREGRLWRRHRERVEEVCWTEAEVRQTLRKAGFKQVCAYDSTPFFPGNALITPGCRTHYVAQL